MLFLLLCSEVNNILILQVGHTVLYLAVRCLNEAQVINLCIYTERRNQSDVRTFRTLNRTQTTIVSIVNVTHLKSGTLT